MLLRKVCSKRFPVGQTHPPQDRNQVSARNENDWVLVLSYFLIGLGSNESGGDKDPKFSMLDPGDQPTHQLDADTATVGVVALRLKGELQPDRILIRANTEFSDGIPPTIAAGPGHFD